jgi:HNH endonuclease
MKITQKYLNEIFQYRDGQLYWKVSLHHRLEVGEKVGSKHSAGYIQVCFGKELYMQHRLIFMMYHGYLPKHPRKVDHIDGDKTNNKVHNLRDSTTPENRVNSKQRENTTGYRGVLLTKSGRYSSRCILNGVSTYFSTFDTAKEASDAYEDFAEVAHGMYYRKPDYRV